MGKLNNSTIEIALTALREYRIDAMNSKEREEIDNAILELKAFQGIQGEI